MNTKATGALIFGFDPYHYYDVKVSGEIVADRWVRGRYHKELGGYTYIYNFTIKFTTINDWAKLGVPINLRLGDIEIEDFPFPLTQSKINGLITQTTPEYEKVYNLCNSHIGSDITILRLLCQSKI